MANKELETKYDPESGKTYIDLPLPKYRIGQEVMFATHATFQTKNLALKVWDAFWTNQLQVGIIVGASFNPDAGATGQKVQWTYFIRSSSGGARDIPDTSVQESRVCGLLNELVK